MRYTRIAIKVGVIALFGTSCAKIPSADDSVVALLVQDRVSKRVHWHHDTTEDQQVQCCIEHMLQQDLKLDTAIQIALLNNPQIQETFEELGIRQADLVEAGLFQNAVFGAFIRFPNQKSVANNTEFSIAQGFLDVFLIPLRKKIATTAFEQTQLHVANSVLNLTFDVQEAYYSLQAAQRKLELLHNLVEVTEASYLLAQKQRVAGNINELELQSQTSPYLVAKLDLSTTQNEIAYLRKKISTLLGLRPSQANWQLYTELPPVPTEEIFLDNVEAKALAQRLDLAQARLEVKKILQMGATKEWWAYTDPAIGISGGKDLDGTGVIGPTFSTILPFSNYGQADRARIISLFKQSQHHVQALEIDIRSEVKQTIEQLNIDKDRALFCLNEVLPLHKKNVSTSQNFYNVMGLSIYQFLRNKQQEIQMKIEYTTSLCNYWKTRTNLNRAVGGEIK